MLKVRAITNLGVREMELSQKKTVETLNKQMDDHPEVIFYLQIDVLKTNMI